MRDLVLGGDGLIGQTLVDHLRQQGHEVTSCDSRRGCDARDLPFSHYEAADRVWFLAWDTGGARYMAARDRQHQAYRTNCELAARVFDAVATVGTPFLFVTSQLAGQRTAYGLTKLMAEVWASGLGGKVARLWNVYGWERPTERSHVATDLVLSALVQGRVVCGTNGLERRRFLYKTDCARALVALFDGPLQTADIAGPEWLTVRDLAEEISAQVGVPSEYGSAPGGEVMTDPRHLLPDWQPAVSLRQGVADVVEEARRFLRSNAMASLGETDA